MEIEPQATNYGQKVDELLQKEKQARQIVNTQESVNILKQIIQIKWDLKEYGQMYELMILLAKRRGQNKKAQVEMVQQCMEYLKELTDVQEKVKLIETIKQVCDKKIFLEVEYARCCLMLVKLKETDDMITEAANILQEVQVETYGSMDRREKLEFILYQMFIMIKKKDYIRLYIISKKINTDNLDLKEILDLKVQYYAYLIEYYNHELKYLETAKCYKAIYETLENKDCPQNLPAAIDIGYKRSISLNYQTILENYILYLVLSPYNEEQSELITSVMKTYNHKIDKYPIVKELLEKYTLKEIISTDVSSYNLQAAIPFNQETEHSQNHLKMFRKQLVQKDIRIISGYYDKIYIQRLSQLLKVSTDECENVLCEMINDKMIFGKIDRISGIIAFQPKKRENQMLNGWSADTEKVLHLIDQTCNLIKQQEELYKK